MSLQTPRRSWQDDLALAPSGEDIGFVGLECELELGRTRRDHALRSAAQCLTKIMQRPAQVVEPAYGVALGPECLRKPLALDRAIGMEHERCKEIERALASKGRNRGTIAVNLDVA